MKNADLQILDEFKKTVYTLNSYSLTEKQLMAKSMIFK